jgi:hypothetical protein
MKMHFSRSDSGETKVELVENGDILSFNYITLVKYLIVNAKLEETTFDEGFSDEEKASVNSMAQLLMQACSKESKSDTDDDSPPFAPFDPKVEDEDVPF